MNPNQTNTTILTVPDIVCGGCAGAIKNALGKVVGITSVKVEVDTKKVTVEHNGETTREKIVEILDDAGFPSE